MTSLIDPQLFKHIRRIQIKTGKFVDNLLAGSYHSAFKGSGIEFEDVRAYEPGDEVRSIDWNVTAKMNYPYVKNYREERELTINLVVDVSSSSLFGTSGKQKNEQMAEIAALLAFSAIKNNDKVGLTLFSDSIECYIPPKKGLKHALRVIRELLVCSSKKRKTDISNVLSFLGKVQQKRAVMFLISDFISPPFSKSLAPFAKKHDVIGIHLIDPKEMLIPPLGLVWLQDLEANKTQVFDLSSSKNLKYIHNLQKQKHKAIQDLFLKTGSGYLTINNHQNYAQAINQYFNSRKSL